MGDTVIYESDGRIGRITLNRPDVMNAINNEVPQDLAECVRHANDDPKVESAKKDRPEADDKKKS